MDRSTISGWFLATLLACGSAAAADTARPADAERFRTLELEWMNALAEKDTAVLERVLAPEFSIIGANAGVRDAVGTREEWLEIGLRHPFPRHEVEVLRVTTVGATAVVQAVLRGNYPPSPFAPNGGPVVFIVTDTWIEREGAWQVLARHSSLARPDAPE